MKIAAIFIKTYLREIFVLATAVILVSVFSTLVFVENQTTLDDGIAKAAIIDQINKDFPNPSFLQNATKYLETAGYDVDLFTTKDITVDFYKELPSMDYEFIVIRTHAISNTALSVSEYLFTSEKYSPEKYSVDQLSGHVAQAVPYATSEIEGMSLENLKNQTYFVIGSEFVDDKMVGKFPDSVIILGGCDTIKRGLLSKALLDRGASAVIGWDDTVLSTKNDKVILALLEKMLVNGELVPEAVSSVTFELGLDQDPVSLMYHTIDAI